MAAGRFWKLPKGVGRVVGRKCARDGVLSVFRCFWSSGFRSSSVFPAVLAGGSLHDAPGEGRGMGATVFSDATVVLLPVIEIYMILYTARAAARRIL